MRYGLPYQGSKNKLAERIVALLPEAEHLYDVFAGGCAISHCALLSRKYERIHISDTNDSVLLFKDVLEGNIPDGSEWISREEFYRRKDTDPYVRLIWSFASNQRDYIYSRDIEPYKKAVHEMIYAPTPNERRLKFKNVCRMMSQIYSIDNQQNTPHELQSATRNKSPETAWRLQSMERVVPPPIIGYSATCNHQNECNISRKRTTKRKMQGGYLRVPFTRGSMMLKSVITEKLKYSQIQLSIAIFPTKIHENIRMIHSTIKHFMIGVKDRLNHSISPNIGCRKIDLSA